MMIFLVVNKTFNFKFQPPTYSLLAFFLYIINYAISNKSFDSAVKYFYLVTLSTCNIDI